MRLRQKFVLEELQNATERLYFVFGTVAAFFTVLSLYFAYRQIAHDSRRDESRENHDRDMRNLVGSFQQNITTISALISTLEQSFDYRNEIEDKLRAIDHRAQSLEDHKKETERGYLDAISSLNEESVELFDASVDRASLSLKETRDRLHQFATRMNQVAAARDVGGRLNPLCYYVRGLSSASEYEYDAAIKDFSDARDFGLAQIEDPRPDAYHERHRERIRADLREMLVSTSFFRGISQKNLRRYAEARDAFREALRRDSNHWSSRNYLLQLMYFDNAYAFHEIEQEFDKAYSELKDLQRTEGDKRIRVDSRAEVGDPVKKIINVLKTSHGNMYLQKEIPAPDGGRFRKFENPSRAVQCYWDAYDHLPDDLASFGLAQALQHVGPAEWRGKTPELLFDEALQSLKKRVAKDNDRLYSIMLYYMMAICAKNTSGDERPEVFLAQARTNLREVPSNVSCFSPVSKVRLSRAQILDEMSLFERQIGG